jgi:hypothetical protein
MNSEEFVDKRQSKRLPRSVEKLAQAPDKREAKINIGATSVMIKLPHSQDKSFPIALL